MYLVSFIGVLCFLLAQYTHNDVVFVISATIAAGCFGMMAWYFSDEDRELR